MAVDNSTQNVVTTKSGTGWTVDVTDCNLLQDNSIKDFRVLIDGSLQGLADFTKVNPTTIQYNGASLSAGTSVEVRRVTPPNRVQEVEFGSRFSSALWEAELNRQSRIAHELEINGALGGTTFSAPSIENDPFSAGWQGQTGDGASKDALYNVISGKAEKQDGTLDNVTLTNNQGNNTTPTVPTNTEDDTIASTSFVHSLIDSDLTNNPTLGSASSLVASPPINDTSSRLATTAYVSEKHNRELLLLFNANGQNLSSSNNSISAVNVTFDTDAISLSSGNLSYDSSTGHITIGESGTYLFCVGVNVTSNNSNNIFNIRIIVKRVDDGVTVFTSPQFYPNNAKEGQANISGIQNVSAGEEYVVEMFITTDGSPLDCTVSPVDSKTRLEMIKLV